MAFDTYDALKTALADHSARTDLNGVIPDFITLFEAHANRHLRVKEMEAYATGTAVAGALTLPSDFLEASRVQIASYQPLKHVSTTWAAAQYPDAASGTPSYYTIRGLTLTTWPATDGEVQLDYYQKIPALSDSNTSNWLLAAHPDVYLQGAMVELLCHVKKFDEAEVRSIRRNKILAEIQALDVVKRPAVARLKGPTP